MGRSLCASLVTAKISTNCMATIAVAVTYSCSISIAVTNSVSAISVASIAPDTSEPIATIYKTAAMIPSFMITCLSNISADMI